MNTSSNAVRGAETASEQLQLELERLQSELDRCTTRLHLTEKLLEHTADAIFVADLDGRIIDVNPAACSLLGYERQELLKMRRWDFATGASWEGVLALISTMGLGDPVTVHLRRRGIGGGRLPFQSIPPTLKYEPGVIVADGDFVIVHGRFSGFGLSVNWIAADILRIEDGILVEHWDVIQDEATQEQSKSGNPMFGDMFPTYPRR
jgi:PAS domain S-box-containing protein